MYLYTGERWKKKLNDIPHFLFSFLSLDLFFSRPDFVRNRVFQGGTLPPPWLCP